MARAREILLALVLVAVVGIGVPLVRVIERDQVDVNTKYAVAFSSGPALELRLRQAGAAEPLKFTGLASRRVLDCGEVIRLGIASVGLSCVPTAIDVSGRETRQAVLASDTDHPRRAP